jgi:hypothetical protein
MTEVHLAVYDLSQGMARSLSVQFLGPNHAIEMIPHTALLVFGKEYFFGGGIQSVDPHYFRRMSGRHPVRTERLGTTRVSQSEFDSWCQRTAAAKFNAGTYDLLNRNCNHFSHEAALQGLRLPQGVPSWILEVPQRFLSSPMGQMVRPMLEQMQITQISPVQPPPVAAAAPIQPVVAVASGGIAGNANPWANMSSDTSTSTSKAASPTKPGSRPITPPLASSSDEGSSILKKYTNPMLSNDTKALNICASKLVPHLNEASQRALESLSSALQQQNHSTQDLVDAVVPELWKLIQEGKVVSFSLLLLRLLALHYAQSKVVATCMLELMGSLSGEDASLNTKEASNCSPRLFSTAASKSLAWCVVSNYTGSMKSQISETQESIIPSFLVEAAIRDWNHDAVQVRQAACTFLYNYVICNGPQLDNDEETVVSLVCSSLESLVEESDPTTRLRRLVVGARVVFGVHHITGGSTRFKDEATASPSSQTIEGPGYNEMAKDLIQDLGFISLLQELATTEYDAPAASKDSHPDTIECRQLALELIEKFQSSL